MATAVVPIEVPKPTPEAEAVFSRWLQRLDDELTRKTSYEQRSEIVRDELHMLVLGVPYRGSQATAEGDLSRNVLIANFDPRNVSLPAEMPSRCCDGLDHERWLQVKPLIWFWTQFDALPIGQNLWLGFRFRNILASHIFEHLGKDVFIYPGFTFIRGYNLTLEDGTRIEPNVFIDDRKPTRLSGRVHP